MVSVEVPENASDPDPAMVGRKVIVAVPEKDSDPDPAREGPVNAIDPVPAKP